MDIDKLINSLKEDIANSIPFDKIEVALIINANANSDEIGKIWKARWSVLNTIERRVHKLCEDFLKICPIQIGDIVKLNDGRITDIRSIYIHGFSKNQAHVYHSSIQYIPIEIAKLWGKSFSYHDLFHSSVYYNHYFKNNFNLIEFGEFYDVMKFAFEQSRGSYYSKIEFSKIERLATNQEKEDFLKLLKKYQSNSFVNSRITFRDAYGKDEWSDTSYSS